VAIKKKIKGILLGQLLGLRPLFFLLSLLDCHLLYGYGELLNRLPKSIPNLSQPENSLPL